MKKFTLSILFALVQFNTPLAAEQQPIVTELFAYLLAVEADNKCALLGSASRGAAVGKIKEIRLQFNKDDQIIIDGKRRAFQTTINTKTCDELAKFTDVRDAKLYADFAAGVNLLIWQQYLGSMKPPHLNTECSHSFIKTMVKHGKTLITEVKNVPSVAKTLAAKETNIKYLKNACESLSLNIPVQHSTIFSVYDSAAFETKFQKYGTGAALNYLYNTGAFRGEFAERNPVANIPWAVRKQEWNLATKKGQKKISRRLSFTFRYGFLRDGRFILSMQAAKSGASPSIFTEIVLDDDTNGTRWAVASPTDEFKLAEPPKGKSTAQFVFSKGASKEIRNALLGGAKIRLFTRQPDEGVERTFDGNMAATTNNIKYLSEAMADGLKYAFAPKIEFKSP